MHILLIDWKSDGRFYCVLYSADHSNPHAELWKTRELPDVTVLSWTYSPRKRDGKNDHRAKRFEQLAGSRTLDIRLPRTGAEAGAFLAALFDLVEKRERADDLRMRLDSKRGQAPFRLPDEMPSYVEGATQRVVVNKYERDSQVRRACIEHWGQRCSVCSLDFAEQYGPETAGLIHVHHLDPLSNAKSARRVDPVKDLRPVCPNCHAVIHWADPPYTLEHVRAMLQGGGSKGSRRRART